MNNMRPINVGKFIDPEVTLDGSKRAHVSLSHLETLWINTGTLCNLTCVNCYIESSPTNERLVYITQGEVKTYLDEISNLNMKTREIGFTGGEPFMNPDIILMLEDCLKQGYEVLVLTNAMKPMHHKKQALLELLSKYGDKITLRVSMDHYTQILHEQERGRKSWQPTLDGLKWLSEHGFKTHVAGRTMWHENTEDMRLGYQALFDTHKIQIDVSDPHALVLFPEMDAMTEVPEITSDCWGILNKSPEEIMCANSRMVVKHKGASAPSVIACTLLPYDARFDLGETLDEASAPVSLNHSYCAKFCVLGGGSCS